MFQEQPYANPYLPLIAQTMAQPAQARADAIRAAAEAQARATEISSQAQARAQTQVGQAWGQAAQNIGQQVSQIPQQMQQRQLQNAQMQDLQQQAVLRGMDIKTVQRQLASQQSIADAIKANADPQTGELNHQAIADQVTKDGFPDAANAWLKVSTENAKNLDDLADIRRQHAQKQLATIGDLAWSATTPEQFTAALGLAASQPGLLDETTAHKLGVEAAGGQWQQLRQQYLPYSPKYQAEQEKLKTPATTPAGATTTTPERALAGLPPLVTGGVLPSQTKDIPPTPQDTARYLAQVDSVIPNEPANASLRTATVARITNARTNADAQKALEDAQGQIGQVRVAQQKAPIQISVATGKQEALAAVTPEMQNTAKLIATYMVPPPSTRTLATPAGEALMSEVQNQNPDYDMSKYAVRAPTRKAFTTGQQGQQLTAMNTAIEHLDQLQAATDALKNGSFVPGNAAYNALKQTFGADAPTNYDTIKNMVDKEVEAVANKGVPTVSGTAEQRALAGKSASPEQIKGYINTLIPLMGSKVNALHYQYQQAMGDKDPFNPLTPQAQAILANRGFNPSNPRTSGGQLRQEIPGHPGKFAVSSDGGQTWKAE